METETLGPGREPTRPRWITLGVGGITEAANPLSRSHVKSPIRKERRKTKARQEGARRAREKRSEQ